MATDKMEQWMWVFWTILGVILIIAEIFTFGFVLFWFGIGALAAALAGYLGIGLFGEFAIFAVVSIALTVLSRTIFANLYSHDKAGKFKTGIDSLPGKIGTVTGASRGALNSGEVKVFGSTWTAFPEEGENSLIEGEKVEVVRVEGSSIYVRRADTLPEWRREKN